MYNYGSGEGAVVMQDNKNIRYGSGKWKPWERDMGKNGKARIKGTSSHFLRI